MKKKKLKNIYEEIILSKNKFYSLLALNTILEKNLINDKKKYLDYFEIIRKNKNFQKKYKRFNNI